MFEAQEPMRKCANELDVESATYKALLESTRAIPWRIDWAAQQFTYIGPQIEELLGWRRESWLSVNDWAERIHPEDRDLIVGFCISQSLAGNDHEALYRALNADGGYVWIRDVVHVERKASDVVALIGFMLKIDDRESVSGVRLRTSAPVSEIRIGVNVQSPRLRSFPLAPGREVVSTDPLIGQLVHDRYRVEKRIGKGGMGVVYLAEHVLLRRKVALKTYHDRPDLSDEIVARFEREVLTAAAMAHEHIVGVTDVGQLLDGRWFIIMEYLDGYELAQAVQAAQRFEVVRALHVTMQLCDAITTVHQAGIVHRDLKPENVFLVERHGDPDFAKIIDFGVCKSLGRHWEGTHLTRTGAPVGTPQYMAPEQIEDPDGVDARTDVYAIGTILYYMLTGVAPFDDAAVPRVFMRICSEPAPSVRAVRPDVSPNLEAVIARALQRRPADRYQSSTELRAALEMVADCR